MTTTTVLDVVGMTCGHCQQSVRGALTALPGVQEVEVDLATGRVTVVHAARQPSVEQMRAAVEEVGFDVG